MKNPAFNELSRAQRRRLVLRAVIQPMLIAILLVALYYRLPMDQPLSGSVLVTLALGLLVVAVLIVVQVRAISRSPYPLVQAIEAVAVSLPLFLLVFSTTYFVIERDQGTSFNQPLTRTDALYFTVTVFSSVGFGDIVPTSDTARILAMIQMMGNLFILGVVARIIVGAVHSGLQQGAGQPPMDRPPSPP